MVILRYSASERSGTAGFASELISRRDVIRTVTVKVESEHAVVFRRGHQRASRDRVRGAAFGGRAVTGSRDI
jgi:hypothetical protein